MARGFEQRRILSAKTPKRSFLLIIKFQLIYLNR